jgi:uncharacterized protein YutE (UPF0331/DUF86 family)
LFDIGRHILAKGFGEGASEYKEIARELERKRILSRDDAQLLQTLAGYQNRLVHFYHEVTNEELYRICRDELGDISTIRRSYVSWFNETDQQLVPCSEICDKIELKR